MIISTDLFASMVVAGVGALLWWANPRRNVNRAVFTTSSVVAAWLLSRHLRVHVDENKLFWVKGSYSLGALVPFTLWLVKEAIEGTLKIRSGSWFLKNYFWFGSVCALAILPYTEIFIPSHSSESERIRGVGVIYYYAGVVALYAYLLFQSVKSVRRQTGAKRIELQVWLCGGSVVGGIIYGLIGIGKVTTNAIYGKSLPIAVLLFYAGTAYAITSHRLFDARQLFLLGARRLIIIILAVLLTLIISRSIGEILSEEMMVIVAVIIALLIGSLVGGWLDKKFNFLAKGEMARQATLAAAQRETRVENLAIVFRELLKGWGHTDQVAIFSGARGQLLDRDLRLEARDSVYSAMKILRWATPERIARERTSEARQEVAKFLAEYGFGLLVVQEGAALCTMVGVGIGASRRPYTYPEVTQMLEIVAIMHGAFERAHFSAKAQHAEQLATVGVLGASLAHEIRNPLVSIKTFVQLLPSHYQDPAFREKFFRLISDEVARMDQLTEQLLDLSAPRAYSAQELSLHPLLVSSVELVAAKASHRHVELITDFRASPDRAFTDAGAAKQVVLNLCFNAIQAVDGSDRPERWVRISTRNLPEGIEMAVADSGPGIAPEIRPKLFQPFQTTKSTGFGLGLAVCSDILTNLAASISVDPPADGQGATFRVIFPCQRLLS